ncbi:MAG: hypothetical protein IJK13_00925 [Lachnospiraceae bacterium]|nr:hypothetical protein [Lachnospiraceae bacterium]
MKKKLNIKTVALLSIITCLMMLVLFNFFNNSPKCYLLSTSNSNLGGNMSSVKVAEEYKWWNGNSFSSPSAESTLYIKFDGKSYNVDYLYSRYNNYNSFATDYYGNTRGVTFGLNSNTGELVYINLKSSSFLRSEPKLEDVDNIKETGKELAEKYAAMYIDLGDYILYSTSQKPYQSSSDSKEKMTFLTYTFVKQINDECSSAYVSVQITSKGHLASIVIGDLNAFSDENKKQIESFKDINIDNMVFSKLEEMTKGLDAPSYEVTDRYYALTPDGDIVICVTATCSYTYINSENEKDINTEVFDFIIK